MTWQPEWNASLLALAIGLSFGARIVTHGRKTPIDAQVAARGRRTDLLETKEAVLEALRHLETERHKLSASEYERERRALIDRGASAMAALDGAVPAPLVETAESGTTASAPVAPSTPTVGPAISERWQGALYALVAVAIVWALWTGAQGTSRARIGDEPITGVPMEAAPDPYLAIRDELNERLKENPQDVKTLNELTEQALGAGDLATAQSSNQTVLKVAPEDIDGAVYHAVLTAMVGMSDRALGYLDTVLAAHPNDEKALTYKGLIALDAGQYDVAVETIEKALAVRGSPHPGLQAALEKARVAAAGADPGAGLDPGAGAEPGPGGGMAPSSLRGDVVVAGTATWPDAALLPAPAVVFVSVRDPAGGPPLAAKKLPLAFPLEFEVTDSDAVAMGGAARPFPDRLLVSVRVDLDGNAMTRADAEPAAQQEVDRGATGLTFELR